MRVAVRATEEQQVAIHTMQQDAHIVHVLIHSVLIVAIVALLPTQKVDSAQKVLAQDSRVITNAHSVVAISHVSRVVTTVIVAAIRVVVVMVTLVVAISHVSRVATAVMREVISHVSRQVAIAHATTMMIIKAISHASRQAAIAHVITII
jgi:hypothetical protein